MMLQKDWIINYQFLFFFVLHLKEEWIDATN